MIVPFTLYEQIASHKTGRDVEIVVAIGAEVQAKHRIEKEARRVVPHIGSIINLLRPCQVTTYREGKEGLTACIGKIESCVQIEWYRNQIVANAK